MQHVPSGVRRPEARSRLDHARKFLRRRGSGCRRNGRRGIRKRRGGTRSLGGYRRLRRRVLRSPGSPFTGTGSSASRSSSLSRSRPGGLGGQRLASAAEPQGRSSLWLFELADRIYRPPCARQSAGGFCRRGRTAPAGLAVELSRVRLRRRRARAWASRTSSKLSSATMPSPFARVVTSWPRASSRASATSRRAAIASGSVAARLGLALAGQPAEPSPRFRGPTSRHGQRRGRGGGGRRCPGRRAAPCRGPR